MVSKRPKPKRCPKCKRFLGRGKGTFVDQKGYLQVTKGPQRKMRLHQLVALAKFGKVALAADVQVHHLNGNRLDCHPDNLILLREADHGAVSSAQAYWFKTHDIKLKESWDSWYIEQDKMIATFEPIPTDLVPFKDQF